MNLHIGWQQQTHVHIQHAFWYVADLPGHDGLKPTQNKRSDWGWTTDKTKAIVLSPYWTRRFVSYCRRSYHGKRSYGVVEVTP